MSNAIGSESYEILLNLSAWGASNDAEEAVKSALPLESGTRASYFVTDASHFGLEIDVPREWAIEERAQNSRRTLQAVTKEVSVGADSARLRITLLESSLLLTFSAFLDTVLTAIQEKPGQEGRVALARLQEWTRLFKYARNMLPDRKRQAGLVLELLTLKRLLELRPGMSLARWTGPDSDSHDFELDDLSIECKATLSRERIEIEVNGVEQLHQKGGKPLLLLVQQLSADPDGQYSVPGLVKDILGSGVVAPEALMEKLGDAGVPLEELAKPRTFDRFRLRNGHEFSVSSQFPGLGLQANPPRIHSIRYTVDLTDPSSVPGFQQNPMIAGTY